MKKIITDCDGVLLDWAFAFDVWMGEQGYLRLPNTDQYFDQTKRYGIDPEEALDCVSRFNQSGSVGYIPAYKDSVEYVNKFAQEGYRFDVISSLHIDKFAQKLRKRNLKHLFGDVFDYINCSLDFTKGKKYILEERYKDSNYIWLEDSASHATAGDEVGLNTYIFDHPYNKQYQGKRIKNWKELYDATH
jgi:FMN phosphatase YigB (HAD superfamily)